MPPESWKQKPALQQPEYPDEMALQSVLKQLRTLPPLVTSWEVEALKQQLAEAAAGKRFLLQGGDCAERFDDCNSNTIVDRLKVLLQMSLVLVYGLEKHVVRVGRFAGQYAKPRSAPMETRGGATLPAYRGDVINGPAFTAEDRIPDPNRMIQAYSRSALTLNFVRALAEGGFADLHHPENWDMDFAGHSPLEAEYRRIVDDVRRALHFMESTGGADSGEMQRVRFYTSHEVLHLDYEQALTRTVPHRPGTYNLSTHLPWIGMRTAQADGAHVEYCRGIANPVGVKVGPDMTEGWLKDLIRLLNPSAEPGRLVFIHRFGAEKIGDHLPGIVEAVRATGSPVLWVCDPMHGNTETTDAGIKTRRFENILAELEQAMDIHTALGSQLGGVHFELTGENVTECTGGARGLDESDLVRAYRSHVDPRLNAEQALEMALSIVHKHHRMRTPA
ncbi:MAG TPA: 3-deoxy-7-phosphoheptulonate synthase class II [Rhodothermales bacterium]|nr:3-deoxy-7-phosphoheptulonate synthase class II [Rhodothermales bacterium]